MNEIDAFKELARHANAEPAPGIDVVDGVLADIRRRGAPTTRLLWILTAVSSAAAAGLAALAVRAFLDYYDPLNEWLSLWWTVM